MTRFLLACSLLLLVPVVPALAQGVGLANPAPQQPRSYNILGVSVEGTADETTRSFVIQTSGLREGQQLTIPGDEALSGAIRRLYELGSFTDVDVIAERFVGDGVFVLIRVEEAPRVGEYRFEGIRSSWAEDIRRKSPLLRGRALRQADINRTEQVIREYLDGRGYRLATVEMTEEPGEGGRTNLVFTIDRGPRVQVGSVRFVGNEAVPDGRLRGRLSNTRESRWWRFWATDTFDESGFEEDRERLIRYYQDRGHFAARIVRDSVWTDTSGDRPEVVVEIEVDEGPVYHVRNIIFDGNTEYTDDQLRASLGIQPGEPFNRTRIEQNLYYTRDHSDVYSLYQDRGFLRLNVRERIIEVPGDSLDLLFEIEEGDVYEFGHVAIRGNTRTKDHVVRRQLRTVPGTTYSRQAVERSLRELMQLNYFDPEAMAAGPRMEVNEEDRTVDLTYNLVEAGGDQLELSGGWGGSGYGLILQARVTFNNFSAQNLFRGEAWRPVPSGDGQQLSLAVQASGTRYQNYSISFTEPFFRGRNTPVGFAVSYTYQDPGSFLGADAAGNESFRSISTRLFARQQLSWPDDFFQAGVDLNYRLYDITGATFANAYGLPQGASQELTTRLSLNRNSFDNPIFPTAGSRLSMSAEVAVPIGGFNQYHKEMLSATFVTPLVGRTALQFSGDFGYIGSLTGDEVEFQRFLVGGSPLEAQGGYIGLGKDLVFMRGYDLAGIAPRVGGRREGGRILNKYSAELRLFSFQSAQFSFAPYLFADAANTWNSFATYNPASLYRSTGVGVKLFLPILGMLDLNYGYALDPAFDRQNQIAPPQWRFQFSIGQ